MENITDDFLQRYEKHVQTPGFGVPGQEMFSKAKILVIGAGALAVPLLTYLSSMGIGAIGLVSSAEITLSDLPAEPLYWQSFLGKSKGLTAVRQLREINPSVKISLIEVRLDDPRLYEIIGGYDLVVDCLNDSDKSITISELCTRAGRPLVYGFLQYPTGIVSVFNYKGSGSFSDMLAMDGISGFYRSESLQGIPVLSSVAGSLMLNEVVKIVAGMGEVLYNKLLLYNCLSNELKPVSFSPNHERRELPRPRADAENTSPNIRDPLMNRAISCEVLQRKIKYNETLQLIDIRKNPDSTEDQLNFLHIPEDQLLKRSSEIHQDIMVILISQNGESARSLCSILNEKYGFDNIYYLHGGYRAWQNATDTSIIDY